MQITPSTMALLPSTKRVLLCLLSVALLMSSQSSQQPTAARCFQSATESTMSVVTTQMAKSMQDKASTTQNKCTALATGNWGVEAFHGAQGHDTILVDAAGCQVIDADHV
jgi:hypothetical protein